LRCARCGNENPESNRFCGMCGAPLAGTGQAAASPAPSPAATKTPPKEQPVITGPSFLGLGRPSAAGSSGQPAADRRAQDPLHPSANVDYLLEDEEPPKRGWGKLLLILLALALALGFGYLHWKEGGFEWVAGGGHKPAAARPATETSQRATPPPGATAPAGAPSGSAANGSAGQPGTGAPATPAGGTAESAAPSSAPAATPAPAPATAPAESSQSTPRDKTSQNPAPSATPESAPRDQPSAKKPTPTEANPKPQAAEEKPAPKSQPHKPAAGVPADAVAEAERYIYGRGVSQDCDRGLRLLKTAAESNPKAMISMGALYSTGTCTPRDLPTAYRWFAMALHKQPDNQALQDDLQKLWSQMTPAERQLAIKLSQ